MQSEISGQQHHLSAAKFSVGGRSPGIRRRPPAICEALLDRSCSPSAASTRTDARLADAGPKLPEEPGDRQYPPLDIVLPALTSTDTDPHGCCAEEFRSDNRHHRDYRLRAGMKYRVRHAPRPRVRRAR